MPKSNKQKHRRMLVKKLCKAEGGKVEMNAGQARDVLRRLAEILVTDVKAIAHFEAYCEEVSKDLDRLAERMQ